MDTQLATPATEAAVVVWLDRRHAYVARARDGRSVVTEVERDADPQSAYLLRVLHEAAGCDRVVVMGPDTTRIDFEREYVSLYRRPDRIIDVGMSFAAERARLLAELRMVEPTAVSSRV